MRFNLVEKELSILSWIQLKPLFNQPVYHGKLKLKGQRTGWGKTHFMVTLHVWDMLLEVLLSECPLYFNPFGSYIGPCPTLWFSCSAPMSEDVRHVFVAPTPLSEPVWCFSLCSTDFGQQIAQVVLFLFHSRPCVLMWTGDRALYSRGFACRKMAGI